jgi:Domain of unknown function (DUF4349)
MATRRSVVTRSVGALLLLALALPACGAGGVAQSGGGEAAPTDGNEESSQMMAEGRDMPTSGGGSAMPSSGGDDLAASGASAPADGSAVGDFDRKIVKTAELGVRAEDVRENAADAQRIAAQFGGGVLSSQIEGDDDSVSADLVLLVPSSEFEAALDELRGLGKKVTTDAVKGEDVTEEFVDLEAQERNLLAAEASLLELYDRAASVNAALAIERELTNIRGQIEQVQGRIQYLEDRTASSRITLSIDPVAPPKPEPPAWNPARVVAEAWDASLAVLQAMATVVLSAVVFGWWLVPVLVLGFVWWRRRGLRGVRP